MCLTFLIDNLYTLSKITFTYVYDLLYVYRTHTTGMPNRLYKKWVYIFIFYNSVYGVVFVSSYLCYEGILNAHFKIHTYFYMSIFFEKKYILYILRNTGHDVPRGFTNFDIT